MRFGFGFPQSQPVGGVVVPPWYGALTPRAAYLAHPDEYSAVAEWGDDTGNGYVLTSSDSGAHAAFNATAVNGKPGVTFASGRNLGAATAADWPFLHSGEYGVGGELHLDSVLNTQTVLSTYTAASKSGLLFLYNGGSRTFWAQEYNASSLILSCQTPSLSVGVPPNSHQFYLRVSRSAGTFHARLYVDGALLKSVDYTGANLVGNPAQALKLALAPGGGNNFYNGGVRSLLLFDHGNAEAADVFAALTAAESQRTTRVVLAIGDSITQSAAGSRRKIAMRAARSRIWRVTFQGSQAPTGNFPLADKRHDGVAGETIAQIHARVAGYSGLPVTDVIDISGTNDMAGTVGDALTAKSAYLDALLAKHTGATIRVLAIPYGTGAGNVTLGGNAGTYNAALPALCATKGSRVRFVDIHSGAHPWVVALHAIDSAGHPNPAGGDILGNNAAVDMGIGGD